MDLLYLAVLHADATVLVDVWPGAEVQLRREIRLWGHNPGRDDQGGLGNRNIRVRRHPLSGLHRKVHADLLLCINGRNNIQLFWKLSIRSLVVLLQTESFGNYQRKGTRGWFSRLCKSKQAMKNF